MQAVCILPLTGSDPRQISLKKKKELCDHYTELLRNVDSRITTTSVRYGDSAQRIILATSEGTFIEQSWVDMEMRFAATARNGETVQTGRETTGSRKAFEDLTALDEQVKEAAQRAVAALSLPSVKGNTCQSMGIPLAVNIPIRYGWTLYHRLRSPSCNNSLSRVILPK